MAEVEMTLEWLERLDAHAARVRAAGGNAVHTLGLSTYETLLLCTRKALEQEARRAATNEDDDADRCLGCGSHYSEPHMEGCIALPQVGVTYANAPTYAAEAERRRVVELETEVAAWRALAEWCDKHPKERRLGCHAFGRGVAGAPAFSRVWAEWHGDTVAVGSTEDESFGASALALARQLKLIPEAK